MIPEVRCVLKTGGCYTALYVQRLHRAVTQHIKQLFIFRCLTDDPDVDFCDTTPLRHEWPGWWSKIELFREDLPQGPSLYLDLDTVVLKDLVSLLHVAVSHDFIALRGFNHKFKTPKGQNFASGIMAGDFYKYSNVYTEFLKDPVVGMRKRANWQHGDQGFIAEIIGVNTIPRLQDDLPANYIVGKRILNHSPESIQDAHIIAWSGDPRLHTLSDTNQIAKLWKGEASNVPES